MKTLALINLKGGTGKTVSAANMAHILATIHRKRVLLVDADKQGNASRYFSLYGEQDGTAALLAHPLAEIEQTIYPTQYKSLDVITSNMDLYGTHYPKYPGCRLDDPAVGADPHGHHQHHNRGCQKALPEAAAEHRGHAGGYAPDVVRVLRSLSDHGLARDVVHHCRRRRGRLLRGVCGHVRVRQVTASVRAACAAKMK